MRFLLEMRTAYFVAKLGTVTAAAESLGVHRATVLRHIEVLEAELGRKIFRRHARGYSTTELGTQLLSSAETIEQELQRFVGFSKIAAPSLDGEFIIASTPPGYSPTIIAAVKAFRDLYPDVSVKYNVGTTPPKLELGEAHVYFHFGPKLDMPDYVLLPWMRFYGGIYAASSYFEKFGNPQSIADFSKHRFALLTDEHYSPPDDWIRENVPSENIIFTCNERPTVWRAVIDGLAIGSLAHHLTLSHPHLQPIAAPFPGFESICWSVTHVDAHRTPKVAAFFKCIKEAGLMGVWENDVDPDLMPTV
ncbi:MAG: LysR family transcriptional regulator [Pseudomonadota bacterium]